MKPVLYVAGPYRAPSREGIELNIQVARKVGALACLKGYSPIIPHSNTGHLDAVIDVGDDFWLEATLDLMRRCDAVVLCPGWELSSGARAEVAEARRLMMPIYYDEHDLPHAKDFVAKYRVMAVPVGRVVANDDRSLDGHTSESLRDALIKAGRGGYDRFAEGGKF